MFDEEEINDRDRLCLFCEWNRRVMCQVMIHALIATQIAEMQNGAGVGDFRTGLGAIGTIIWAI